jgi:hypothetical protein
MPTWTSIIFIRTSPLSHTNFSKFHTASARETQGNLELTLAHLSAYLQENIQEQVAIHPKKFSYAFKSEVVI